MYVVPFAEAPSKDLRTRWLLFVRANPAQVRLLRGLWTGRWSPCKDKKTFGYWNDVLY